MSTLNPNSDIFGKKKTNIKQKPEQIKVDSLVKKIINLSVCLQFPHLFKGKLINDLYSQAKITENSGLQLLGNVL